MTDFVQIGQTDAARNLAAIADIAQRVVKIPISDRAQWLQLRLQDVTASDAGAICGVDKRRSPLRVFAEKVGRIPPSGDNAMMKLGRWFEPAIMVAVNEKYPDWTVRKADVYLRDPVERIGATPDFVVIDPARPGLGNLQGKVVAKPVFESEWVEEDGTITPPLGYQLQTITEAKLIGASWAALGVLVHAQFSVELHIVPVELHDAAWHRVRGTVADFWRMVAEGRQPNVTPELDHDVVKALFPQETGATISLAADNMLPELLDELLGIKAQQKILAERRENIETEVIGKVGDAAIATLPGWEIKYPNRERKEFTVKASKFRQLSVKRVDIPRVA